MTKREIILIIAIFVIVIIGITLWLWTSAPKAIARVSLQKSSQPSPYTQTTASGPSPAALSEYPQLSLKAMSKEEATRIYVERLAHDPLADGKVVLNFYGKVVDENNQPVPAATVHLQWNTILTWGGTKEEQILSDGSGLFSLTAQHGKVLEVRVEKEGYYTVEGGQGALAFEFANPSSSVFSESDSNNPVIFHLRKKGAGANLVSKSLELILDQNHSQDRVNLMLGFIKPDGLLLIQSDKPDYRTAKDPFSWKITFSLAEGGFIETNDQFPFFAPEGGYASTEMIDMTNINQASWSNTATKTYYFYIPSTNTYGRMTVNTLGSSPSIMLNYVYNSSPGQRSLEPVAK
jgi:hypothetical protein